MENLGALAGATEANDFGRVFKSEHYINRAKAATVLHLAIADCHPEDAAILMEAALERMAVGAPIAPLLSAMDEAAFWADLASRSEHKAYALACFRRLSSADRAAFLAYVGGLQ